MAVKFHEAGFGPAAATTPASETPASRPVLAWATIGALILAFEGYIIASWILAGEATSTPTGPDPVPTSITLWVRAIEVIGLVGAAIIVYLCVYRPWKRDGRLGLDGYLVAVFVLLWWQDPLQNYFQIHLVYTSAFTNLGSWTAHVPGWMSPNSELTPIPLAWGPAYIWLGLGPAMAATAVMRRAKARRPNLSTLGVVAVGAGFLFLFEFTVEPVFLRSGVWAYPGAIEGWTLFPGTRHQFPVYEGLCMVAWWGSFACLRYFRNDKGQTIAERGLERIHVSPRRRAGIRFLALLGVFNVAYLLSYTIPMAWIGAHSDTWPQDVQTRSYLTSGLCGPGTDYACPDSALPIARNGSVHFSPDGRLVVPDRFHWPSNSTGR